MTQSLIALGERRRHGVGFTASRQKLLYLPEPHSDFVFAVIGEELASSARGLLVVVFCVYALRGALLVSSRAPDQFGVLLGVGATLTIAAQALLNISVATGLLPTTGLPPALRLRRGLLADDHHARRRAAAVGLPEGVMSPEKRLLVRGGRQRRAHLSGAGGVARAFAERGPAAFRFVGTPRGLEDPPRARGRGFPLDLVVTPPLRGRSLGTLPRAAFRLVGAFARMRRLIRKFRPQVVFGTGGRDLRDRGAGGPDGGDPVAHPGTERRGRDSQTGVSAPSPARSRVGFDATRERFSRAVFVSGIPVRADFLELAPPGVSPSGSVSVLVTGGSQGASRLNRMVVEALPLLRERLPGLRFTHQTGAAEEEAVRQA